jgi:predicted AAA+ superfamily ATPase
VEISRHRYIAENYKADLGEKFVFIGGPRQVGKTTLALHLLDSDQSDPGYLNRDITSHRQSILAGEILPTLASTPVNR